VSLNLQDFSPGTVMATLVRGYNERRKVLGLKPRSYSGIVWTDVDDINDATVKPDAIIQDVKFWNELLSAPVVGDFFSNGTEWQPPYFTDPDGLTFGVVVNDESAIAFDDIISVELIRRVLRLFRKMDLVIYNANLFNSTIIRSYPPNIIREQTTRFRVGPFAYAFRSTPSPSGLQYELHYSDLVAPSFGIGIESQSLGFRYGENRSATLDRVFDHEGNLDGAQFFETVEPPSVGYWQNLGAVTQSGSQGYFIAFVERPAMIFRYKFSDFNLPDL